MTVTETDRFHELKLTELRELAKDAQIKSYQKYRKNELIALLEEYYGQNNEKNQEEALEETKKEQPMQTSENTEDLSEDEKGQETHFNKSASTRGIHRSESGRRVKYSNEYDIRGVIEILETNNFGFLRGTNYLSSTDDVYVSPPQIRRFDLRTGDEVKGYARYAREGEKFAGLTFIEKINGENPEKSIGRPYFEKLTPYIPRSGFTWKHPVRMTFP